MKIMLIIILFIYTNSILYSQHEGIERHFNSYTNNIFQVPDYGLYNDTSINDFFLFMPQNRISGFFYGYSNPGTPMLPMIYSERPKNNKFFFLNHYSPYISSHNNIAYFDANKPFTVFSFTGGAKNLELVQFLHTQNINPHLNFCVDVNIINSDGFYMSNKSKVNNISLSTAYTKKRYQSWGNIVFNKIDHFENGGIKNDSIFENTNIRSENLDVNLRNAKNEISQIGMQYTHEYRFGNFIADTISREKDTILNYKYDGRMSIIQDIKADRFYRIYSDSPSDYYQNIFNDSTTTYDSTSLMFIEHSAYLQLYLVGEENSENQIRLAVGMRNELFAYTENIRKKPFLYHYLSGKLIIKNEKSFLSANLDYGFAGTGLFDIKFKTYHSYQLKEKIRLISDISYMFEEPDIILLRYNSNHFNWDNDFRKSMSLKVGSAVNFERINTLFGFNFYLLNNYVVFNHNSLPEQSNISNSVTEAFIKNVVRIKNIYLENHINYQYVSKAEFIPLPPLSIYSSLFYSTELFNNAAVFQTGVSSRYFSKVFSHAYMPATGVFYLQNQKVTGNYYMLSYHIAVQVKRLRGFINISNINTLFSERNQYKNINMPDNPFAINFGVSWEFYD